MMTKLTGFNKVSLDALLKEIGEEKTREILSGFSCPLNKDVEKFIKFKALEFEKQRISRTQLIFTSYKNSPALIGYYTLATKSFNITKSALSASMRKKIKKFATYNPDLKAYEKDQWDDYGYDGRAISVRLKGAWIGIYNFDHVFSVELKP